MPFKSKRWEVIQDITVTPLIYNKRRNGEFYLICQLVVNFLKLNITNLLRKCHDSREADFPNGESCILGQLMVTFLYLFSL